MDALRFSLLNDYQRGFPLAAEPYRALARELNVAEAAVIGALLELRRAGAISRIGATFRPGAVGASTLAAMAVPPERLAAVAAQVSRAAGVNHNYERENDLNLWFVATAPDSARLDALVAGIGSVTGLEVLALPLVEEYHIDLGFDLRQHGGDRPLSPPAIDAVRLRPTGVEGKLLEALQDGIEISARPYAALAGRCGMSEAEVLATLARWQRTGVVRRFGVIVRHHELGYIANAMVVWDVADAAAAALGRQLASKPDVTLCYLRARALPRWRFNLYCMVHGKDRDQVLARVAELSRECGLEEFERNILFSRRRFKQTGARYANTEVSAEGAEHGRA